MELIRSKKAEELAETEGMSFYTTRDGVRVCMCHYSADPDKNLDTPQGRTWLRKVLAKGYPGGMEGPDWQQEMEMSFSGSGSAKVWPNFPDHIQPKITCTPFEINEHWPIYCGYDYGTNNPFAWIAVAWEDEKTMYVFDEVYKADTPLHEQVEMIKARPYFHRVQGVIGDPSIWRQNQESVVDGRPRLRSVGEMLRDDYGITVERGNNLEGVDIAFREMINSTLWRNLDEPQLYIFDTCKNLFRELRKLRYKSWATDKTASENNRKETLVQKDNHAWDALKYLLLWKQGESPEALPAPVGSFDWLRNRLHMMKLAQNARLA